MIKRVSLLQKFSLQKLPLITELMFLLNLNVELIIIPRFLGFDKRWTQLPVQDADGFNEEGASEPWFLISRPLINLGPPVFNILKSIKENLQ